VRWALAGVLAGLALAASWYLAPLHEAPTLDSPRLCLSVLDVGQGDALLLSFPGERYWLVDGGGVPGGGYDVGRKRLLPMLRRMGVEHLDKLFVSHAHADHFEGLFAVLEAISGDELWLPSTTGLGPRAGALVKLARRRGLRIREAARGAALVSDLAPVDAELLYPWPGWEQDVGTSHRGVNNSSMVLRVALGRVSFLLTGDIEAPAERLLLERAGPLRATVMKVPHHASNTSSTAALVAAVDPLVAVAGIGEGNRFGFPHASVSSRYLSRGTPLYWTGRHGSMRLCTGGFSLRLEQVAERGRSRLLRQWDVDEISRWSAREHAVAPSRAPPRAHRAPAAVPARRVSKRPAPKKRLRPLPEPAARDVTLLDEREWRRSRKARKRLRAPWR
jgi:competence protein ComEC